MRASGIALALLTGFSTTAAAETARVENGARFGGWTVACEALAVNETLCVLSQRLVRTDSGTVLAELIAFNSDEAEGAYVAARVPNGVFFPSGFVLGPQDGAARLEFIWQTCTPDICEALLTLGADELDMIGTSSDWVAGYRPGMTSDSLAFRVTLEGLEEGLTALAQALGQPGPRPQGAGNAEAGQ